jgi:hypothetical protein
MLAIREAWSRKIVEIAAPCDQTLYFANMTG